MTLRTAHGRPSAEDVTDVEVWLRSLPGCPTISVTSVAQCDNHGDEAANWFYVEADCAEGVARTRCIGCGKVAHLLDSHQRWSYPPTWACANCQQSIAEVVAGGHEAETGIDWLAIAVRCVECGVIEGVADAVVTPAREALDGAFAEVPTPVF